MGVLPGAALAATSFTAEPRPLFLAFSVVGEDMVLAVYGFEV